MLSKAELRKQLRHRRAALSPALRHSAAVRATAHLVALASVRRARTVALYLGCGTELSTAPLLDWLWSAGKEVYVPKLGCEAGMHFVRLGEGTPLRRNRHNISEPAGRRTRHGARQLDVIILPLLGFDLHGNRLGTGGGYYDRALAFTRAWRKPVLIGYALSCQQITAVPAEPWDIRLDAVVTETGIQKFCNA